MKKKNSPGFFESGTGFYYYTGKLCDMILVSILWLLGSLLVATIGASFSAIYAVASRSIRRDTGTVWSEFWKAYRRDLKKSILLWLCFAGALFVLLLNAGIIWHLADGLPRLFLIMFYGLCTLLVLAALCYAFPALSRFDMPVKWFLKLSFYMVFRHLPVTLLLLVLFAVGYLLVLAKLWTVLFVPGVLACVASRLIDPLLEQHKGQEEDAH
ncbi:MAG: DUF624 domain-containing protein [Lachnospiraceae bacterium]|nr:DUF624 domain-containing protein [Lachnospiraceae bacterium]